MRKCFKQMYGLSVAFFGMFGGENALANQALTSPVDSPYEEHSLFIFEIPAGETYSSSTSFALGDENASNAFAALGGKVLAEIRYFAKNSLYQGDLPYQPQIRKLNGGMELTEALSKARLLLASKFLAENPSVFKNLTHESDDVFPWLSEILKGLGSEYKELNLLTDDLLENDIPIENKYLHKVLSLLAVMSLGQFNGILRQGEFLGPVFESIEESETIPSLQMFAHSTARSTVPKKFIVPRFLLQLLQSRNDKDDFLSILPKAWLDSALTAVKNADSGEQTLEVVSINDQSQLGISLLSYLLSITPEKTKLMDRLNGLAKWEGTPLRKGLGLEERISSAQIQLTQIIDFALTTEALAPDAYMLPSKAVRAKELWVYDQLAKLETFQVPGTHYHYNLGYLHQALLQASGIPDTPELIQFVSDLMQTHGLPERKITPMLLEVWKKRDLKVALIEERTETVQEIEKLAQEFSFDYRAADTLITLMLNQENWTPTEIESVQFEYVSPQQAFLDLALIFEGKEGSEKDVTEKARKYNWWHQLHFEKLGDNWVYVEPDFTHDDNHTPPGEGGVVVTFEQIIQGLNQTQILGEKPILTLQDILGIKGDVVSSLYEPIASWFEDKHEIQISASQVQEIIYQSQNLIYERMLVFKGKAKALLGLDVLPEKLSEISVKND